MSSVRVGHYLMVSLWMLRYRMNEGGYSIGFCGSSRLVFRFWWVRFGFSACNKLMLWKFDSYVISSMTRLNVSATPGIVITRIGSWVELAPDALAVELSESLGGRGALNYVSSVDTIHVLQRLFWETRSVANSPSLQLYSLTKSTAVTPSQLSQSAGCKSLLLPARWKSVQAPFHPSRVLLGYQHPNPPPRDEADSTNLVRQTLCSGQTWNWIFVAWNTVIYWFTNWMSIQQPDRLLKTLGFKFVVDWVENSA